MRFAVATAMRQEEICRIFWEDIDLHDRTIVVRDRKDPRDKVGNHQRVPLLDHTGFDAWSILQEQRPVAGRNDRVFPYNPKSISVAFTRACQHLKIKDLRFHDLRHEATTRLFEAGFRIEQVALVTGHKDWKMLKRYTNLRPEQLHRVTLGLPKQKLHTCKYCYGKTPLQTFIESATLAYDKQLDRIKPTSEPVTPSE